MTDENETTDPAPEGARERQPNRGRGQPPSQERGQQPPGERGGPKGPEPTRFGDWEKNGRCFDF